MARLRKDRAFNRVVGGRIKAIRESLGMTQDQFLAYVFERTGVRYVQSALSGIESGDKWITADDLKAFGCLIRGGANELLRQTDEPSVASAPQREAKPRQRRAALLPHEKNPDNGRGRRRA